MGFKIMVHSQNQHGWGVSLIKYRDLSDSASLEAGFVLISCKSPEHQKKYVRELAEITGFEVEQGF